ncbi:MAG: acyl-CoA-binding protein [Sandaracinaceae bacterium]|jgi:carboxylesterase|nr:acyl-CoA-binding protein [Sandaracinaceae bacterium]
MATTEEFEAAVKAVNTLSRTPSTDQMLELYGLYKQATTGDASGGRPGLFDPKGRAKYDAWASRKGMTADGARAAYVSLAKKLGA